MNIIIPVLKVELIVAIAGLAYICLIAIRRSLQTLPRASDQSKFLPPRSSSLELRQNKQSANCCLLKSNSGRPLTGGALKGRAQKLQKLKIWL